MLVVTKVEVLEVPEDEHRLYSYEAPQVMWELNGPTDQYPPEMVQAAIEHIKGRRYWIPDIPESAEEWERRERERRCLGSSAPRYGKEICIGIAKQVDEVLGTPLQVIEVYDAKIRDTFKSLIYANAELSKYKLATLWQRIKFLFKRFKP